MPDADYLQKAADAANSHIPDGHGFILITTPFDEQGDGLTRYASNITRETAVKALKAFLLSCCDDEWLKHIEP